MILRTDSLTKYYGKLIAVDNLTLEVQSGEVFGFLGPNGAGKTTSINMMCGLLAPDSGQVLIDGQPLNPTTQRRVGVCPQDIVLWERLTCLEQLQFMGQMYGLGGRDSRQRGVRLLNELGLSDKGHKQARTLSGGMQRRLNLAMALIHDPDIVILDEPEAGLDPQSRVQVRDYIRSLARRKTVILTTHNMDEAERMADRVAIIDQGRLLELDTPEALKRRVGAGDVVELQVSTTLDADCIVRLRERLEPLASQILFDGQVLTLRTLDALGKLARILDTLEQIGVPVSDVRLRENALEDVFIQLTGRRLRE